jgi:hypothetical protein
MAQEPYSSKGPLSQIALAPALLGLVLIVLGVLMIAYWQVVLHILAMLLAVLLGVAVLAVGAGLLFIGLDLWDGVAFLRRNNVKIDRWRIRPDDKD